MYLHWMEDPGISRIVIHILITLDLNLCAYFLPILKEFE